jgi:hypothetical protein
MPPEIANPSGFLYIPQQYQTKRILMGELMPQFLEAEITTDRRKLRSLWSRSPATSNPILTGQPNAVMIL